MAYFTQEFIDFFTELETNNNKTWFDAHRKQYETSVKKPFETLVQDLIQRIQTFEPAIVISPKEAIYRINRDIRFSKDKTPYNTEVKATISQGGKKSIYPGYHFALNHKALHVGGGIMAEKGALKQIRDHITQNPQALIALASGEAFTKLFGRIKGEQNKRLPPEYQEALQRTPIVANKQFYYMARCEDPSLLIGDKLLDFMIDCFKVAQPLNAFFKDAVS